VGWGLGASLDCSGATCENCWDRRVTVKSEEMLTQASLG
jgi:hypothetical protein